TAVEDIQVNTSTNRLEVTSDYNSMMTFTNTLNFQKGWDKHEVSAMLGSEAIEYIGRGVSGEAAAFFSDNPNYLDLNNGTLDITNASFDSEHALFSLFGRVDYTFDDKYL